MSSPTPASPTHHERTFFGHPIALASIFGVEMWERFSFYGMQGILLIYLYYSAQEGGLGIAEGAAAGIVGAYGGGVYLSAILGGWLADRILGAERVLFYSAITIMCGHIALALLPGVVGVAVGLILVAVGSGALKTTTTSAIGSLYSTNDPRRDAGFSIYYLGINLGGLFGPILTGLAQSNLGFHFGFGLAAIGMACGLVQYSFGRKRMPAESRMVPNPLPSSQRVRYICSALIFVALVVAAVLVGFITYGNLANVVIGVTLVSAIIYFLVIMNSPRITKDERRRVWGFIPLFIATAVFWSLYQQQFTAVTIYSDQRLDRNILGFEMPVSWIQSINPIFIIILASMFAALWTKWGTRQPTTVVKFGLANMFMGAAFLLFLPFANTGQNGTPLLAMVGILFIFTIAELLISPVGLSVTTKLAPKVFHTQMISLLYLSWALGTAMSGALTDFYHPGSNDLSYFGILGLVSVALGIVLVLLRKPIQKLMTPVH